MGTLVKVLFTLAAASPLITGCAKKPNTITQASSISPTYSSVNQNIFQPVCISCHVGAGTQGIDFSSYNGLLNSITSQGGLAVRPYDSGNSRIWIRSHPGGGMPPTSNGLSQPEADVIKAWIDSGALNN